MLQAKQEVVVQTWMDEVWNWKNWFPLGFILLVLVLLEETIRDSFGLDLVAFLKETIMTVTVVSLGLMLAMPVMGMVFHFWVGAWRTSLILLGIVFSPLAVFEIYAHYEMSHALAPLKQNFMERAEGRSHGLVSGAGKFDDLLVKREAVLREYCYLELGGWRAGGESTDLTAVYVFTACAER